MDVHARSEAIRHDLIEMRNDFHRNPELGDAEHQTSARICGYLDSWGIPYRRDIAGTGVIGLVRGNPGGRSVALRAEMDALPVAESEGRPNGSLKPGLMHACGHDAHMAINLGAARILKELSNEFNGNVLFFFQPAEETTGGAERMIEAGCMKNPAVDYILGLHVDPNLPCGMVALKYGQLYATSDEVRIYVRGQSGHGAYPEGARDAIVASGFLLTALQTLVSRRIAPQNPVVLTIGSIHGGTKENVIADEVQLHGTMRMLNEETRQEARSHVKAIVENTARAHGTSAEIEFIRGFPPLWNQDKVIDIVRRNAEHLLGPDSVIIRKDPELGEDDFAWFLESAPGAYFQLGCGPAEGTPAPLHSSGFDIDEECLRIGVELQITNILSLLDENDVN